MANRNKNEDNALFPNMCCGVCASHCYSSFIEACHQSTNESFLFLHVQVKAFYKNVFVAFEVKVSFLPAAAAAGGSGGGARGCGGGGGGRTELSVLKRYSTIHAFVQKVLGVTFSESECTHELLVIPLTTYATPPPPNSPPGAASQPHHHHHHHHHHHDHDHYLKR
jgi:hypothetical protein